MRSSAMAPRRVIRADLCRDAGSDTLSPLLAGEGSRARRPPRADVVRPSGDSQTRPRNRAAGVLSTGANSTPGCSTTGPASAPADAGLHSRGRDPRSLAMPAKPNGSPREALTFDDVLLQPGLSDVLPSEVAVR